MVAQLLVAIATVEARQERFPFSRWIADRRHVDRSRACDVYEYEFVDLERVTIRQSATNHSHG
jgi:hypothetical protein